MSESFSPEVAAFDQIVRTRRSVRRFTEEPIPESVMRHCLELATLAPTSSNLQPWRFYWVRDAEKKSQMRHICLDQLAGNTAQEYVVVAARTRDWRKTAKQVLAEWPDGEPPKIAQRYYTMIAPFMYSQGPLGILGVLKALLFTAVGCFRAVPREPIGHGGMKVWATKTTALAAENFVLAMRAHGFDTCMMEGMDSWRIRRMLKLPRDTVVLMVIGAGRRHPERGLFNSQYRVPIDQVVFEV